MAPEAGTTYRNIEEYLADLEKRQDLEKAPIAAVFMLGSDEMLQLEVAGHPWLTRVRCELPTRPLGPGGEEVPVRATYIGRCNDEDPAAYQRFVNAMRSIDVHKCVHLKVEKPSARALAHLEESDIVVIGDGPHVNKAWEVMSHGEGCIIERVKWRYYCGAVLVGIGKGAQILGERWWINDPRHELESRTALSEGKPDPHKDEPNSARYLALKATEIVPCLLSTDFDESPAAAELIGSGHLTITLPAKGGLIFNVDGCLEPCAALLYEHKYDWKTKAVKMSLLWYSQARCRP